jgi:hypothetical protein
MLSGLSISNNKLEQRVACSDGLIKAHATRRKKRALISPKTDTSEPGEMKAFNLCDQINISALLDQYKAPGLEDK